MTDSIVKKSKVGVIVAAAVGAAFATLAGCASQQSGAATPANLPHNCAVVQQPEPYVVEKNRATCKHHHRKHHHHHSCQARVAPAPVNPPVEASGVDGT